MNLFFKTGLKKHLQSVPYLFSQPAESAPARPEGKRFFKTANVSFKTGQAFHLVPKPNGSQTGLKETFAMFLFISPAG